MASGVAIGLKVTKEGWDAFYYDDDDNSSSNCVLVDRDGANCVRCVLDLIFGLNRALVLMLYATKTKLRHCYNCSNRKYTRNQAKRKEAGHLMCISAGAKINNNKLA